MKQGSILVLPVQHSHQGRDLGLRPLKKGLPEFSLNGSDAVGYGVRPNLEGEVRSLIVDAKVPHDFRYH